MLLHQTIVVPLLGSSLKRGAYPASSSSPLGFMPKKYQPNYAKQSYTHSSLSFRSPNPSSPSSSTPQSSVNDLLNQLRREQAPRPTAERRDEVALVGSQRTVPPTLRSILNFPETAPIVPRRGLRPRGRRDPGPAAPASWLQWSRHAQANAGRGKNPEAGNINIQAAFKSIVKLPAEGSLAHFALRQMASDWEWYSIYEQNNLCTLPPPLKSLLTTYIAVCAPPNSLTLHGLKTIFFSEGEVEDGGAGYGVDTLDLSGQIGRLTLPELTKYLSERIAAPQEKDAESWEEEAESVIVAAPSLSRFPHLTRLSLAHPVKDAASWPQLLNLSKHLNFLTHLSLAYWPTPSITPNSQTARIQGQHGRSIQYSGTDIYAALDDDYYEAANILRRFSINTYSLKWLDLSGCSWIKALTWEPSFLDNRFKDWPGRSARKLAVRLESQARPEHFGPDWNSAWSQIEYLCFSPSDAVKSLDLDKDIRWVTDEIRALRSEGKGKYCFIDRGNGQT